MATHPWRAWLRGHAGAIGETSLGRHHEGNTRRVLDGGCVRRREVGNKKEEKIRGRLSSGEGMSEWRMEEERCGWGSWDNLDVISRPQPWQTVRAR